MAGRFRGELYEVSRGLTALGAFCAAFLALAAPAPASVTRSGTLEAVVTDDFRSGESATRYLLRSGEQETVVRPTELAAEPGDRVIVTGTLRDGRLVGAVEATPASTQAAVAPGPRKVALILIASPGDPAEPWPPSQVRSEVFTATNSADAFYSGESHGAISLTGKLNANGDVFGWLRLDTATAGCPGQAWRDEADEAAADAGIDLTGYDHLVYMFPYRSICSWLGQASLGGDWAMINGNLFGVRHRVIVHELGHNLGLLHAGSWTCTSGGTRVQISDTCTTSEYGDPFDAMGNIDLRHNNGWNLAKLGILTEENVETVDASGTYSIRSALHPTTEPTALRVPRTETAGGTVTSWYYLEVREKGGIFENVSDASMTGVSIRATAPNASVETLLLDGNPETAGFGDAPLQVGQTFDGSLLRITTLAAGGGSATVSVELDEEPPTVPDDLEATVTADGAQLSWVSTDNMGVERYFVFRDGEQVGNVGLPSFLDTRVPAGDHDYVVVAEDGSGNQSDPSAPLTVTVPAVSGPTCANGKCKLAFRYSGAPASWTVPPGVDEAFLTVEGASGGGFGGLDAPERVGGSGARIWATLEPLAPGQIAEISVGGQGDPYSEGGAGGFNGGGDGGFGGGGGGHTKVELDSTLEIVAAGGGGGGARGTNGTLKASGGTGGAGSQQGSSGGRGVNNEAQGATLLGGGGGVGAGAGGAGGSGGEVTGSTACPGGAHAGAAGAAGSGFTGGGGVAGAGGGGGGGYVGGGQGGAGAWDECAARAGSGGGGGGSSFVAPGRLVGSEGAGTGRDGWLSVQYDNPVRLGLRSYVAYGDQELDVPVGLGVLSDGSTPDGVSLSAALLSAPDHGALTLRSDGSFTYAPEQGFLGSDSFSYRATDTAGNYADATIALNVAGPPAAAIAAPAGGGTYVVGQVVPTTFSCSEGLGGTGLSSCVDSRGAMTASGGAGRLDTSTAGLHTYIVTATSKTGLTDSASIDYRVVPAPVPAPLPPGIPPAPPGELGLRLFLQARGVSLSELLRTGKLVVAARVNEAAKLTLRGGAVLKSRRGQQTGRGFVALLERKTVRFAGAGVRTVALEVSPRGRRALARLGSVRLVIFGEATDRAGEAAGRRVALTLR